MNNLKKIAFGDTFTVTHSPCPITKMTDKRVFKCLGPDKVELLVPSDTQINADSAFRDGSWKDVAVSDIEPEWYRQRGFEVV